MTSKHAFITETDKDHVLHLTFRGKVERRDLDAVIPEIERRIKKYGKVSLLVELVHFEGWSLNALWQDTKFGARHYADIERIAIVGDSTWEKAIAYFAKPFSRARIRYFDLSDEQNAWQWVMASELPPHDVAHLRNAQSLTGFSVAAEDGVLGRCADFLFDDRTFKIRYMVVNTGGLIAGQKVLVAANVLGKPDLDKRQIPIRLTRKDILASPKLTDAPPVSMEVAQKLRAEGAYDFYVVPYYWAWEWDQVTGPQVSGPQVSGPQVSGSQSDDEHHSPEELEAKSGHLRSMREITGYDFKATDGYWGAVVDFLIDDEEWGIRHLVADTGNWLPGERVLVNPDWVTQISWSDLSVELTHSRAELARQPLYVPGFIGAQGNYQTDEAA